MTKDFINAYFEVIDFYEDNLTEDNVDEIVNMLEEMFPADVLLCLIRQGYFIAPTQVN
jgi:hypothetical protein